MSASELSGIKQLDDYNIIIISVHSDKITDSPALQKITKEKAAILVNFTSPYRLSAFQISANNANSLIVAYDNSEYAQMSAAQGIFGGIGMSGKLPVSSGTFKEGTGITTNKTRLSYSLPEEVGIASSRLENIEHIALEGVRQRAYPGCQILVAKNGVIIYEREFGNLNYGDSPDVTTETVYDLASVTKASATVPAIMKLYDEKKIALQDNIGRYVKETKGTDKENIRIRSLLLHESGLTAFIPYYTTAIDKNSYTGSLFGQRSQRYNANYAGAWGRTDYKFHSEMISSKPTEIFYQPVASDMYASDKMKEALLKDIIISPVSNRGKYRYSCLNFI